jgi:hypothetical protein
MKTSGICVSAVGFSLIGLVFCILSVFELTNVLCITQGCSVYDGFSIFGISLYWLGAAAFFILLCAAVVRRGEYLLLAAAFFVILNMIFLLIQVLLWPCASCLIVAVLFGAVMAAALFPEKIKWARRILAVWFLLFAFNGIAVAKESLAPWPIYGKKDAAVRLFFSPTCPSCQTMMNSLLSKTDVLPRMALFPISKSSEDTKRIMILDDLLRKGVPLPEAMIHYQKIEGMDIQQSTNYVRIVFNTFKNLMALSRLGVTHVPYLSSGMPFWSETAKVAPLKDDCPVFSRNPAGLCEDAKSGGLKELFKSQ